MAAEPTIRASGSGPVDAGPWRLEPNRIARFYAGGEAIDRFRGGASGATEPNRPEDWLGSTTRTWRPPGSAPADEGLSSVETLDGPVLLRALLERDPAAIGGAALVDRAGATTGLLVKLLDAGVRLPVHCHPSRAFARRHLGSFFGKAEAWIILGTRQLPDAEPPNVRLGFREPVARDDLLAMIEAGDTAGLLGRMHRRPARAGEVWFIPPGLPHAIGAGVFIAEIQEPSDFSILAETRNVPVRPEDASVGLGWELAVEAFDRRGWDDRAIGRLRQAPEPADAPPGISRTRLTGRDAAPFFRAERLRVEARGRPWSEEAFLVGIVVGGRGEVRGPNRVLPVAAGSTFAVGAAALAATELVPDPGADALELIAALPPAPADLAADRIVP